LFKGRVKRVNPPLVCHFRASTASTRVHSNDDKRVFLLTYGYKPCSLTSITSVGGPRVAQVLQGIGYWLDKRRIRVIFPVGPRDGSLCAASRLNLPPPPPHTHKVSCLVQYQKFFPHGESSRDEMLKTRLDMYGS
jgi:hypothetical protein